MSGTDRVFAMPDLGEGLEEGEIVAWLVAEGDAVELNQPLVEVETAKATVEIPAPFAGVVIALHGAVGATVPVGEPLVTIGAGDEGRPPTPAREEPAREEPARAEPARAEPARATPPARADELQRRPPDPRGARPPRRSALILFGTRTPNL